MLALETPSLSLAASLQVRSVWPTPAVWSTRRWWASQQQGAATRLWPSVSYNIFWELVRKSRGAHAPQANWSRAVPRQPLTPLTWVVVILSYKLVKLPLTGSTWDYGSVKTSLQKTSVKKSFFSFFWTGQCFQCKLLRLRSVWSLHYFPGCICWWCECLIVVTRVFLINWL